MFFIVSSEIRLNFTFRMVAMADRPESVHLRSDACWNFLMLVDILLTVDSKECCHLYRLRYCVHCLNFGTVESGVWCWRSFLILVNILLLSKQRKVVTFITFVRANSQVLVFAFTVVGLYPT